MQLTRSHEARLEYEVRQAAAQVDITNELFQVSEAQAQLRLQEQAQRTDMLISELRRALKETADQATPPIRALPRSWIGGAFAKGAFRISPSSRRAIAGMEYVYRKT